MVDLQVDFEMSFEDDDRPDWKMIHECGKKLDDKLEELNLAIRKCIHTKIKDAQGGAPDAFGVGEA